jgi:hypothetical protein
MAPKIPSVRLVVILAPLPAGAVHDATVDAGGQIAQHQRSSSPDSMVVEWKIRNMHFFALEVSFFCLEGIFAKHKPAFHKVTKTYEHELNKLAMLSI